MTIRESVMDDRRARNFAWGAIVLAVLLATGTLLVAWHIISNPWPPSGVSEGVDP